MKILDSVQEWWHRDEVLTAERNKALQERIVRLFGTEASPEKAGYSQQDEPECPAPAATTNS